VNFCRVGKYMFTTVGAIDRGHHRHEESYPWAPNIDSRIKRWIGDILANHLVKLLKLPIWITSWGSLKNCFG